jgi:hypothetical protein
VILCDGLAFLSCAYLIKASPMIRSSQLHNLDMSALDKPSSLSEKRISEDVEGPIVSQFSPAFERQTM